MKSGAIKTYTGTGLALLGLLALTWGLSYFDLGEMNFAAGMSISVIKAGLIAAFFMHLRGASSRLIWVAAGAGVFWLGLLLVLAMCDYLTR